MSLFEVFFGRMSRYCGALAEKLGTGLQNLVGGSVTRTHLH